MQRKILTQLWKYLILVNYYKNSGVETIGVYFIEELKLIPYESKE
jgi:hypothetical protein